MKALDRRIKKMLNFTDRFMIEWNTLSHMQKISQMMNDRDNKLIGLMDARRQNDINLLLMRYLPQIKQELKNEIIQSIDTQIRIDGLDAIKRIDTEIRKLGR